MTLMSGYLIEKVKQFVIFAQSLSVLICDGFSAGCLRCVISTNVTSEPDGACDCKCFVTVSSG